VHTYNVFVNKCKPNVNVTFEQIILAMALTETRKVKLGFDAPKFSLLDVVRNEERQLKDLKGERATVFMFICNHCPYVIHVREQLVKVANDYLLKGISFIAISSNDVEKYPQDGPEEMRKLAEEHNFPFPYLYDETQEVAKAYQAQFTPDFMAFNADLKCVYRGRLDNSTPGNGEPVTGKDLRMALNAMLEGEKLMAEQFQSMGCNIKWKV